MKFNNSFGTYYLGQNINKAAGLRLFTQKEYKISKVLGMKPMFENEQFFDGLPVYFASVLWDFTTLGVINGIVYKIAI